MPGKVKVKIIAGKNLPVMDRSSDTTDAYVEIKLGSTTYKTDVCRKSLNPQWNSDWYRFEVDDSELQDEPLQIRLMDHDTYSANDAIGKVYLDLNPLLLSTGSLMPKFSCSGETSSTSEHVTNSVMSGWIPVYDTMHGIRGEVNVIVKVELFSDFNRFRQSSCGVQFFCSPVIPHGYYIQMFHGFVEELIVNDDPEYQWIDKIRTPRASNEARQTLFFKLSGELQRKIGVKALELGGNAVVGYSQCFDLEGESGVVVRGIGTAVTLIKLRHPPTVTAIDTTTEERALSYLQFLRHDSGFHLNRDSFKYPIKPTSFLSTSALSLNNQCDTDTADWNVKGKRNFTRHLSYGDFPPPLKTAQSLIRTENIHHASSLQTLLQQEEMRGNPGTGISQRLKNFKYSSQNMLAKKMTALKAKLSDSGMVEEDHEDSKGSVSNISVLDGGKKKSVLFQRSTSESNTMAELLVRSLMHTSLDCIAETHDSTEASLSPSPASEINDKAVTLGGLLNKIDDPIGFLNKSISEPSNLRESQFLLDASSNDSSSDSSSSDDEDETLSDVRDDANPEYDTVSNIIKNVAKNNLGMPCDSSSAEVENFEKLSYKSEGLNVDGNPSDVKDMNDVAPLAECEDFEIGSRTPVHFLIGDDCDDNSSQSLGRRESINTLPDVQLPESPIPPESIIPPVKVDSGTIASQGLVETAMKTMLLEKLSTIGTYTPPASPTLKNKEPIMFAVENQGSTLNLPTPIEDQLFRPKIMNTFDFMRQTPTSLSNENQIQINKPNELELSDMLGRKSNNNNAENVSVTHENSSKNPNFPPIPTKSEFTATNIYEYMSKKPRSCLNTVPHIMPVNTELDEGSNNMHASLAHSLRTNGAPAVEPVRNDSGHQRTESVGAKISQSPARFHPIPFMHRRSSDSDLSITPKGSSLTGSDKSYGLPSGYFSRVGALLRPPVPQENFDMLEYPFLTLTKYPPGFIIYLGGVVSARSVKLLERITNLEEPESRDTWWTELRMEIRSHARSIGCNAVLAYSETSSICDDVCVLSASGTAAVIGFQYTGEISDSISGFPLKPKAHYVNKDAMASSLDRNDFEREKLLQKPDSVLLANIGINTKPLPESPENEAHPVFVNNLAPCTVCHLPYAGNSVPLRTTTLKCAVCRSGRVPDVLLATTEMPEGIPSMGRGCFIQAHVCRQLKDMRSESGAKDISDGLPFLEYELHRILVNKIKIKGMNAVFGLKVRISIGIKMLVGIATGTGVFLLSLPPPPLPKLVSDRSTDEKKLAEMQKLLSDTVKINKEIYQLKINDDPQTGRISPDNDNCEDEQPVLDLAAESRDCCILEVDDPEDMEIMNFLMEPRPPDGFHVVNTELVPGLEELEIVKNLQMFTQIWRAKLHPPYNLGKHVHKLLESVYFKLRRMIPCALCDLQFRVDLPESDEIQISILGMALGLAISQNSVKYKRKNVHVPLKESMKKNDEEMIFKLEDDHLDANIVSHHSESGYLNVQPLKHRGKSPQRLKMPIAKQHMPHRERHGVDITPLSYVPGGKIERYLGNLNFFFIRETTSIREEGGLSGFIHSFITEVLAIVRAHIAALGGNAMVAYYMTKCVLSHSVHKNQAIWEKIRPGYMLPYDSGPYTYSKTLLRCMNKWCVGILLFHCSMAGSYFDLNGFYFPIPYRYRGQCLINVGGDVVFVSYFTEE